MKKKVAEILNSPYEQYNIFSEPSKDKIEKAIREKDFDERGFQRDLAELNTEWNKASSSVEEYSDHMRQYHARRIAYFVVNKWNDPILLKADGRTVKEGTHRLKAAIYLGMETVEVEITDDPA